MKADDLALPAFMLGEMNGRAGDIVLDTVIGLSRFPEIVSLLKLPFGMGLRKEISMKSGQPDEGCLQSPGTAHCGTKGVPFCAEAWDAVARYIYTGLQGGSIMRGWMKEENTMIACCNDGTRPVIFKIERIDCE